MISIEDKVSYHDDRVCGGCGFEPEVIAYFHRNGKICGHHCTCGAIVIDDIVVGNDPQ